MAIEACGLRVPEGTPEGVAELADRALKRIADVMEERVHFTQGGHVLKAATHIRLEVCGAPTQKHEHSFASMTDEQLEARYAALTQKLEGEE